ncbi:peptide ABC transporter permease [Thermococcus gorgonarius]|uniref:Peptide ABC transporter permease n=2 Tax=Thermococcus gorgonarius TaxID=71997 RepID=A0A2Z2MAK9_THEGO|nr:peptide ABC transporter permease [Thermococcus gorgonarius]
MRIVRDVLLNLILITLALILTASIIALVEENVNRATTEGEGLNLGKMTGESRAEMIKQSVKSYFRKTWDDFTGSERGKTLRAIGLTFAVLTMTMALIFLLGLYWGLRAGYRGGWSNRVLSALAPVFSGIPAWFWALLFLWTLWWKWDIGAVSYANRLLEAKRGGEPEILAQLSALLIPVLALTLSNIVVYAFSVRNLVKREASQEYFFIDVLKGLPDRRVMRKLLRTVLPSFLTFTSYNFLNLMINGMAVEKLFEVPGIGKMLADSATVIYVPNEFGELKIPEFIFDGASVFFVTFVMAVFYFLNSTILEALYLHLDPRREINE